MLKLNKWFLCCCEWIVWNTIASMNSRLECQRCKKLRKKKLRIENSSEFSSVYSLNKHFEELISFSMLSWAFLSYCVSFFELFSSYFWVVTHHHYNTPLIKIRVLKAILSAPKIFHILFRNDVDIYLNISNFIAMTTFSLLVFFVDQKEHAEES